MSSITSTTQIPAEVNNFYDRTLLINARPRLVHRRWAQRRPLPANAGTKTIKFRRYGALATNTTALTEGITPAGKQLSTTTITATVSQYGDFTTVTDVVSFTSKDRALKEAAEVLGWQAGETIDELCRDVIVTGTNVYYGGDATSRVTLAAGDNITTTLLDKVITVLENNKTMPITTQVAPDPGYNTSPVAACFIGIVHPFVAYTLEGLTGFTPVEEYANKADVMDGEIGKYRKIRFIVTPNAKVFSAAGASSENIYATLVFGKWAYGDTEISGQGLQNIRKPYGSGGTNDPLNQRATSGWKATYVAKILNDDFMVRIETTAAFEAS